MLIFNVCSSEKLTKRSSNTLLCLVSFSAEQTLCFLLPFTLVCLIHSFGLIKLILMNEAEWVLNFVFQSKAIFWKTSNHFKASLMCFFSCFLFTAFIILAFLQHDISFISKFAHVQNIFFIWPNEP